MALCVSEAPKMCCPSGILDGLPENGAWWVAHVKSRREKALAAQLAAADVGYFLPLAKRVTSRRGRKCRAIVPLFPGYLFFAGDSDDRYRVLATNHVARVLDVADQEELVNELSQLRLVLGKELHVDPYPFAMPGRRVRVVGGPLMGLEGTVLRRKGRERLVLRVSFIRQSAMLQIDGFQVEPID